MREWLVIIKAGATCAERRVRALDAAEARRRVEAMGYYVLRVEPVAAALDLTEAL